MGSPTPRLLCLTPGSGPTPPAGPRHSILRYFEGQNAVTRVAKGEIRISPKDVRSVRQFSGDDSRTGDKTHGIIINTLKEDRVFGCHATRRSNSARRQTRRTPLPAAHARLRTLPAASTCTGDA